MSEAALETALKYWAADKEGISVLEIESVEFDYDPGWGGTDVTPGDPPEVVIRYVVRARTEIKRIEVEPMAMTKFISEVAETSARVNRG